MRELESREQEEQAARRPALPGPSPEHRVLALQRGYGNAAVSRMLARATAELEEEKVHKDDSPRFEGDKALEKVQTGKSTLKRGSRGLAVTKLQQALVDAGFKLPKDGVNGAFEEETEDAVKAFQKSAGLPDSGVVEKATMDALHKLYDTRQPYIDNAKFDPKKPGTRNLSADDKKAVNDAMVPARGTGGGSATFQDEVGGVKYGDAMRKQLKKVIASLHKELYESKEPLRKDPAKNMHSWNTLEGPAAGSKDVVDALYSSYVPGKPPPAMTHKNKNFVDQWEDEEARNAKLSDADKLEKARGKVWYLIASNCSAVNEAHSAVPTDTAEKKILTPIVEALINTKAEVQTMLDLETGWEGAQLEGVVYLQRYKQDTKEKNRAQLWELFHTCIHEYLHGLAHPTYQAYAQKFYAKGDTTRYNTLIEGFCDFFTLTVRKTVKVDEPLRQKVEGPYYDAKAPLPVVNSGVYPSVEQAEQVVSIAGIRNAEAAYFRGDVQKLGAP